MRFLVTDQGAIRRRRSIDTVLPARLPEDLVSAEKRQVQAGVSCSLDIAALLPGPVFVVAVRHEDPMIAQQRAAPISIHARRVTDVVAVGLEPTQHRVLGIEQPAIRLVAARCERTVVAHRIRTTRRRAFIEAVSSVIIVGLPGRVGRLEKDIGATGVITNDKHNVARTARVATYEACDVDTRNRIGRNRPGSGHGPVAAVDQPGGRINKAIRLHLRQGR